MLEPPMHIPWRIAVALTLNFILLPRLWCAANLIHPDATESKRLASRGIRKRNHRVQISCNVFFKVCRAVVEVDTGLTHLTEGPQHPQL